MLKSPAPAFGVLSPSLLPQATDLTLLGKASTKRHGSLIQCLIKQVQCLFQCAMTELYSQQDFGHYTYYVVTYQHQTYLGLGPRWPLTNMSCLWSQGGMTSVLDTLADYMRKVSSLTQSTTDPRPRPLKGSLAITTFAFG